MEPFREIEELRKIITKLFKNKLELAFNFKNALTVDEEIYLHNAFNVVDSSSCRYL